MIRFLIVLVVCLLKILFKIAKIAVLISLKIAWVIVTIPARILWGNSAVVYKYRRKNYGKRR